MKETKYIFVMGGVLSGLGKGIAVSSIGKLLQSRGYKVTAMKIDPYVNVDAGTMNPTEHGEVFVTKDGLETDQDIGNYERFLGDDLTHDNYMTTGQVYMSVIQRERNLAYQGRCVEVVPHIPQEVIRRVKHLGKTSEADIVIVEIGGTIGEYQNLIFLEAARMMKLKEPENIMFILVSFLPIPSKLGEMKTKPTQYAARTLNASGIQPDFILCRAKKPLDKPRREKISIFCNIDSEHVISAPDVKNIYEVPIGYEKEDLSEKILNKLKLKSKKKDLGDWKKFIQSIRLSRKKVKIGIVGKYFGSGKFTLADSYISVIEALKHASWYNKAKPQLEWINSEEFEEDPKKVESLKEFDGIVVPQGWGSRGSEGKILTIKYLRENKIPFLGLCYGMQMAVVEYSRNVAKLKNANSLEIDPKTPHPVIYVMADQEKYLAKQQYGGTIRLGDWPTVLTKGTRAAQAYGNPEKEILERHRHRYEFNNDYVEILTEAGLTISGTSPDQKLVEVIEISDHPFFVGVQFHPEYKSQPLTPHPLFIEFIKVSLK
ncbi:MAG: CTP synthase [Patescibacteria group bacterium]